MPETLPFLQRFKLESFQNLGTDITLGRVEIDRDKCAGCRLCTITCAAAALEMDAEKKSRMVHDQALCIACGGCEAICDSEAIKMTQFFQFHKASRFLDRGAPSMPRRF